MTWGARPRDLASPWLKRGVSERAPRLPVAVEGAAGPGAAAKSLGDAVSLGQLGEGGVRGTSYPRSM